MRWVIMHENGTYLCEGRARMFMDREWTLAKFWSTAEEAIQFHGKLKGKEHWRVVRVEVTMTTEAHE